MNSRRTDPKPTVNLPEVTLSEHDGVRYLHLGTPWVQGSMKIDHPFDIAYPYFDDLIALPAGTTHWFDTGEFPNFTVIRLFITPEGWVARYTGDEIATHIPLYEGAL